MCSLKLHLFYPTHNFQLGVKVDPRYIQDIGVCDARIIFYRFLNCFSPLFLLNGTQETIFFKFSRLSPSQPGTKLRLETYNNQLIFNWHLEQWTSQHTIFSTALLPSETIWDRAAFSFEKPFFGAWNPPKHRTWNDNLALVESISIAFSVPGSHSRESCGAEERAHSD